MSELNGYETPLHIFHVAGIHHGVSTKPGFPVGDLAQVLGRSVEELDRIAYRRIDGDTYRYKILGHDLSRRVEGVLRLQSPAFCLQCVEESQYIDVFWDLNAAIACPKHRCRVLRQCSTCNRPIRWFRPGLLTCHCGARFSHPDTEQPDHSTFELMSMLEARLHDRPVEPSAVGFPLDALAKMSFASLLHMLNVLGAHGVRGRGSPDGDVDSVITAAAAGLAHWPYGYHSLLAVLGNKFLSNESAGSVGFRSQFEHFYGTMFRNRSFSASAGFLREEFIAFGLKHWGQGVVDPRTKKSPSTQRRFVSRTEYARRHGLSKTALDRMIADGSTVTKVIHQKRGKRVVVDVHLSKAPPTADRAITAREAARRLELPVSVIESLRTRGLIARKPRSGRRATWYASDVDEFRSRCLSLAGDDAPADVRGPDSVALGAMMRKKFRRPDIKADIVAAMVEGILPVVARAGDQLGDLWLAKMSLDLFLRDRRAGGKQELLVARGRETDRATRSYGRIGGD